MKKYFFVLFFSSILSHGQSYFGFQNDNYAGIHVVTNNPANLVDSRFRSDINLFSANVLTASDIYSIKYRAFLKSDFGGDSEIDYHEISLKDRNNFIFNSDILGPSFMFNLKPNQSLALFSRFRILANVTNINGNLLEYINGNPEGINETFTTPNQNFNLATHSWAEVGASYARVLKNTGVHFLKGGLSVKVLRGVVSGFIKANNFNVSYLHTGNENTNTYTTSGTITSGNFHSLKDSNIDAKGIGFGADLGFTYEFRPEIERFSYKDIKGKTHYYKDVNKYLLRVGFSVTDIGYINYKNAEIKVYDATAVYTEAQGNNDDFEPFTEISSSKSAKMITPTAIHANVDWNFNKNLYLNLNTDLSLIKNTKQNSVYIANNVTITPRYEIKWISVYVPVSFIKYSGFDAGFGFRAGPLFVGSTSVVSGLLSKTKAIDIHAGLKIPIYQNRIKDKDFDGIIDKLDNCPDVAGPIENKGCPWGDVDSDGVFDHVDKCPKVAGPIENKGCPWGDVDSDGVFDHVDKCPKVAGPIENNGCPWGDSDSDGVFDHLDKCPEKAGPISNSGCPEIIVSTVKTLNDYTKSILFATGKSTFEANSINILNFILSTLKEYPSSRFSIEGHTDNVGDDNKNMLLSEQRAQAIRNYLIENGIEETRLEFKGFGETKPISSNDTEQGKKTNRRVEIILIK